MWDEAEDRELSVSEAIGRLIEALREARRAALPPASGKRPPVRRAEPPLRVPGGGADSTSGGRVPRPGPSRHPGGKKGGHHKRRPRAPQVLEEPVRQAFVKFMKRNTSMSDASVQMFSGAGNALIYRVLLLVHGEERARERRLGMEGLADLLQDHEALFATEVRGAYANLPRIYNLLRAFTGVADLGTVLGSGGGGGGLNAVAAAAAAAEPALEPADEHVEMDQSESDSGDESARYGSRSRSRPGLSRLALDGPPQPSHAPEDGAGPQPSPHPRVVGLGAPSLKEENPDVAYGCEGLEVDDDDDDMDGIIFGLAPPPPSTPARSKHRRPVVLGPKIRRGFTDWMTRNTGNRGNSLKTIFRLVNGFLAKSLSKYRGDSEAGATRMGLEQLKTFIAAYEAELTTDIAEGTNASLKTFWRHFVNYISETRSTDRSRFPYSGFDDDEDEDEEEDDDDEEYFPSDYGSQARGVPKPLKKRRKTKKKVVRKDQPWGGSVSSGASHRVMHADLGASAGALPAGVGKGLAPPSKGRTVRRSSPMVLSMEVRQGFLGWMQTHTRMQPTSMSTALRTANRVVATLMLRYSGEGAPREMGMEAIRDFIDQHSADFLREVSRTANVSVRTFWRHFLRFLAVGAGDESPSPDLLTGSTAEARPGSKQRAEYSDEEDEYDYEENDRDDDGDGWEGSEGSSKADVEEHVRQQMENGEVLDVALLEVFETWLSDTCYFTPTIAWSHCRDMTELAKGLAREGGERDVFLRDVHGAAAFFDRHRDSELIKVNERVFKRWQEFMRQTARAH
jgi:hypothetical protein